MIKTTKLPVRILSFILSILLLIGIVPLNAFAFNSTEGSVCSSRLGEKYIGSDGEPYGAPKDFDYLTYNADGSTVVRHKEGHNFLWHFLLTDSAGEERYVYCVEAGVDFEESTNEYISSSGTNSRYYQNLPYAAQFGIMLCTVYGWTDGKVLPIDGINTDDYMVATQVIIWEYQQGLRTSPAARINNGTVLSDTFYNSIKNRPAELAYNWILNRMSKHYVIPSFTSRNEATAPNMTLRWNQSANKYTLTVTDTNGTLADIKLDSSNIQITRSGNKYTFSSSKEITSATLVKCRKNVAVSGGQFLIWGRPGYQTMVCGAEDPVFFFFKIQTEADGICRIKKTSEDGKISGVKFTITGNGANITAATGADGTADITLKPGIYTVTEQTADRYNPQNTQRVTVVSGQTATVNFNNTLKRGDLTVTKTSEDGLNEGMKFHLYGTSLSGLTVDEYAVTDSSGKAYFKNVLIGTGYTLEEVDTPIRYVIPDKQTAAVEWNKVTNKSFVNTLKKWNVTVTKSDRETGTAQGDANLSGAFYGILKVSS